MLKSSYPIVVMAISIIILTNSSLISQNKYTVFAKSGLSLRAEASINSERLQVVPFRSKVSVHEVHYDKSVVIEGVSGYWVEVNYKDERGFMFSGYLVPRDYYEYEEEGDYVVLDEFEDEYDDVPNGTIGYLDLLKFNDSINWYGVKISDGNVVLKRVELELNVFPQKIQSLYTDMDGFYIHPILDSVASLELIEDSTIYNFFLGTEENLANWSTAAVLYHDESIDQPGKFISPYQPIALLNGDYMQSEIIVDSGCVARYEIFLLDEIYRKFLGFSWGGDSKRSIEAHMSYQSPRIVCEGDINQDGFSDFLFYVSPMADKCVRSHHELYISREGDGGQVNYQVHYGVNLSSMDYY